MLNENKKNDNELNLENQNETIRVNLNLLDELMVYAGELVLARNQLMRLTTDLIKQIPGLSSVLQDVNLTTSILQEKIMNTRMQPISMVFSKFPRLVRDLQLKTNKKIRFDTSGNDVNLDKSVIENLYNPLAILVYYLINYDLESSQDRIKQGKDETAHITLKAYHEGGKVNVDINSDGLGLNPKIIIKKAIENGIISENESHRLSKKETINLLFTNDFFTFNAKLEEGDKEVSLQEARIILEKIGGTVNLDSETGKSTYINIKLPLTLVIIPSIIITVNKLNFAIPQVSLQEIVRIRKDDPEQKIENVNGAPVLRLRNKLLPILYLWKVLNMKEPKAFDDTTRILVLRHDDNEFGLVVDEIFDHEEIVVKTIPNFFKDTLCYSGTTIMGDGSVALILDVNGLSKKGKLNFVGLKEQVTVEESEEKIQQDIQNLLLFENDKDQFFALNLDLIKRIEKVNTKDIDKVGQKEYIEHEGKSLTVIRLENFLPISAPADEQENLYVIIPKAVENPIGIITRKIVDSISVNIKIDTESIISRGLIGSSLIDDKLVLFPDIYELIELAEPEKMQLYKIKNEKRRKMLLVEDTPFFRSLEKNYFESAGYDVEIAIDGMDGYKKAMSKDYDIFVVDLVMPRMDGYQFIENIRKNDKFKNIPALALTTLTSEESKEKAFKAGFNAYEIKLHKEKLISVIKNLLNTQGRTE
ncbi:MAG: chemotaxis protein CheW [Candidatus Cloacimonetes bacterium]|jgi:two-component system chemotaxis sensor kinase CheA|nr:chemotaxis protein CheW [Candidatus Cloacimonadota bacterium]